MNDKNDGRFARPRTRWPKSREVRVPTEEHHAQDDADHETSDDDYKLTSALKSGIFQSVQMR